jgi:phosphoglycolate phosphatase-like HAD superfamily hydrolase
LPVGTAAPGETIGGHADEIGVPSRVGIVRRLVLWDIDGTLIRSGDIGAAVFDRALVRALGAAPARRVRMSGKTDPQIVLEYLALMEVDDADQHVPCVLGHLEAELAAAAGTLATDGAVLPGVQEVLVQLAAEGEVLQSVLTGNIAPNAVVKLTAFGLQRWLDLEVGAYGSDHADRRALVPIARHRARVLRGATFSPDEVWVVGDSPNDLACARAGAVRCLLVGTGRTPAAELADLHPDALAADLSDVERIVELLSA